MLPSISPPAGPDRTRMPNPLDNGSQAEREVEDNLLEEVIETPDKPEYVQWTKVVHRKRARSDGSLPNNNTLTSAQRKTVNLAEKGMTKEQQQKLQRRQEKVRPRRDDSVSSREEGPSNRKGKAIDPREWGNVDFSREDLNIDAQIAALRAFKAQLKAQKRSKRRSRQRERSR